ncbi:insecticidal delta-endotoxin Cry8Ea1 family protein [Spirosoma jeollabukense]
MLGFGSAFLLPSLLQSCMQDHVIPDPTKPPTNPPALFDAQIDWNDDAKTAVTTALGMIPEAGEILSGLVDIFWPKSKEDVWGKVKTQVETLVQQDIAASVYQHVQEDLDGLNTQLSTYLTYLNPKNADGTPGVKDFEAIRGEWRAVRTAFDGALPHFQSTAAPQYQLPLLGLFSQFANLYLGFLRDAVAHGSEWGMQEAELQSITTALKNNINDYYRYTAQTYNDGRLKLWNSTKRNDNLCEPFRTVNNYDRQMTLTILDFMYSWYYYDVTVYKSTPGNPIKVEITREIYSDPYGSCDDSGVIGITTPVPTQRPTSITVWGYDRIDAVQLTYPANSGPGGLTTTPRMGNQNGGNTQPPHGGIITNTPNNPIIAASVYYALFKYNSYVSNPLVAQLQFLFDDRTTTDVMGGTAGSINGVSNTDWIGYPYEALSSIHINGVNKVLGTADSIVFGFTYWKSPDAQVEALRKVYVTSPTERSVSDFAQAYPSLAVPAGLITDELKAARKAYWDSIKARAK